MEQVAKFTLHNPSFKRTVVPLGLMVLALVILNWGLYHWMRGDDPTPIGYELPQYQPFDSDELSGYINIAGEWEVRDGTLVQLSPTGYDLIMAVPLNNVGPDQPYEMTARLNFLSEQRGGGFVFNMAQATVRQKSHMVRFNLDGDALYLIYGYYDDASNFTGQGDVRLDFVPAQGDWTALTVQITGETYQLLVNDVVVASQIPAQYRGGSIGLTTSNSQVAFDDLLVRVWDPTESIPVVDAQPTPGPDTPIDTPPTETVEVVDTTDTTTTQVFQDTFNNEAGGESPWVAFSGTWAFETGAFVQGQADGFDFGAGYTGQSFTPPYTLQVTLQHREGIGGGVLFNMAQPNDKLQALMVRYGPEDGAIMWGYFDEGGAFIGVGNAAVPLAQQEAHQMTITVNPDTYTIAIDGQPIAQDIPANYRGGYIGLTASQSVVAFSSVEVLAEGSTTDITEQEFSAITGQWETVDGITTQTETAQADFIAGVGVFAEVFQVSVQVKLPEDPELSDAGGGLVFHMNGRDDPTQGHMVRFGNGGTELLWGRYDAQGVFLGEGGVPLELDNTQPHTLTLTVAAESYSIAVDDEILIENIPLQSTSGWMGLVSFRGNVQFSAFGLELR